MNTEPSKPFVRYADEADPIDCPYGTVRRIVTGGEAAANMHLVRVTQGGEHFHQSYDEIYYVTGGNGHIIMNGSEYVLRPGAVVVIPAGVPHSLAAEQGETLEFMIVGIPGMPIDSEGARARKPE